MVAKPLNCERRRTQTALTGAIALIILAACGDEGAGDANDAAPAPSTASVPTPAWMDVDPGERLVTDDEPQSFSFQAAKAGHYILVCLVPAHALTRMGVGFEVSSSGESGLRT